MYTSYNPIDRGTGKGEDYICPQSPPSSIYLQSLVFNNYSELHCISATHTIFCYIFSTTFCGFHLILISVRCGVDTAEDTLTLVMLTPPIQSWALIGSLNRLFMFVAHDWPLWLLWSRFCDNQKAIILLFIFIGSHPNSAPFDLALFKECKKPQIQSETDNQLSCDKQGSHLQHQWQCLSFQRVQILQIWVSF